jgi:hypothetical protein
MEQFDPIDIQFNINNGDIKASTDAIKNDLKSVGQTAEETANKINAQINAASGKSNKGGDLGTTNAQLAEQDKLLKSVSDKHKSLLSESMATYAGLSGSQKTLIFQYHENIAAIDQIKIAQNELNAGFESGKIGVIQYTQAQAALSVQQAKLAGDQKIVKDALLSSNQALGAQAGLINRAKPQWNGLGNSINQITRELPAFALSAQTGFLAISNNIPILADEIGRLRNKNIELTASGQKAVPVWSQVVKGLLSWGTALSAGVVLLTVYGKDIVNWIGKLFQGKQALDTLKASQDAVNKSFDGGTYQKVIKDVNELRSVIKLAKDGFVDKKDALKLYNDTLGDVYKHTNDINEAEQIVIDKAPAFIQAMLYKTAAMEAASEAAKNIAENQKKQFEISEKKDEINARKRSTDYGSYNPTVPGSANVSSLQKDSDLNKANKELDILEKEALAIQEKSSKIIDSLNRKAAEIAKGAGLDIFGGKDKDPETTKIVSAYQSLLDKLSDLDKEYARKSYTKDEEEMQALRDKFNEVRTLVQRFNADPKNKAQIIDLKNLNKLEVQATETLGYRQTTEKLKTELDAQKKLYEDFEEFKKQFGQAAAETEFADKITAAKTYYDYLKEQQKANATAYENVDKGTATGGEVERVNFINKALEAETALQKKLFDQQLADLLSYQKKRDLLIEKYNAKRAKLIASGKTEEAAILDEQHQEELDSLDDANTKKLASYKALFNGLVGMTAKQVKKVIADMKLILATQKMSAEMILAINKKIAELENLMASNKLDEIFKLGKGIADLGGALFELGEALGSRGLADGGALLSGLGQSLGEVLTIFDKDSSNMDKIAAGISGVVNMITMFADAATKRKQAEEEYYLAVIGFQNDYNMSLQEQIRLRSILNENVFIKDYEGRIKDALGALGNANTEYQKALDNLMAKGQAKVGLRNAVDWGNVGKGASSGAAIGAAVGSVVPVVGTLIGAAVGALAGAIGGLFGGKKKKDKFVNIMAEYPELIEKSENGMLRINKALAESLIANNLVNKETKQILENILAWDKALEEARAQIKEVITELTGNLSADLKNNLVDAFVSGENAAIKMGQTVEKVLENIISSFIFNSIFSDTFDELEKQMAESMDLGGDGNWVDDFARFFSSAGTLTEDFNNAMAAAQAEAANFGFDVFNPDNAAQQSGAGGIRRDITEETGSELLGLFRGQYDITRNLFRITEEYYAAERSNYGSILQLIAINTRIETNTANTVTELQSAVKELKIIADNTHLIYLQDV